MKKIINKIIKSYSGLIVLIFPVFLFAQETTNNTPAPAKEYVKNTFENSVLLNSQTVENTKKKSLDFMIQHRFGVIKDAKDLYGIYAPSNIRLGLAFGILKRVSIGVGVTKDKMIYDFQAKAVILKQTKKRGMPVTLTYYGDIGLSAKAKNNFLNQDGEYKVTNKLTYFNEIMIARKFGSHISLQLAGTYTHLNLIDSAYDQHDFFGGSVAAKFKFSPQSSILVDFDYLFNVSGIGESIRPKPNLTIGYELSTGGHQFQVFVGTAQAIINQEYRVYNQNDIAKLDFVLGFNITRIWDFK